MESLGDEPWDIVICGTGLRQSLLALALSRSDKRILHLDPNDYYGELEAALNLEDADSWTAAGGRSDLIERASTWRHPEADARGLASSRSYSLSLAPQIIHTRCALLSQLVDSRAYRQVEFLAVGSFFVYEPSVESSGAARLSRIPSSREDVFSTQSIPARSKRSLMKFLKFVVDYDSDEQRPVWEEHASRTLVEFLTEEFKLDGDLQKYILALTLTLDGKVTVKTGLSVIHRHLSSIGMFGPGFCAVYPKWGGSSEIAQVGCRAGAVGGGIYMLDTAMTIDESGEPDKIKLALSSGESVQTSILITAQQEAAKDSPSISRVVAVVNFTFPTLFEVMVEGAPVPGVAMISIPAESTTGLPVYASIHSSDTGECPKGQSVVYLTTLATSESLQRLDSALDSLLKAVAPADETPLCLYKLSYEQSTTNRDAITTSSDANAVFNFPSPPLDLAFDDASLEPVKAAWKLVTKGELPDEKYMTFEDREGADDHDEVYD